MTNNTMMKMTNKEAIECIKVNICYKQSCCNDGICKSTDDRPCAIDMATEALEKQIPKKPSKFVDDFTMYKCDCGEEVFGHHRYCPNCSQALDWSEEE